MRHLGVLTAPLSGRLYALLLAAVAASAGCGPLGAQTDLASQVVTPPAPDPTAPAEPAPSLDARFAEALAFRQRYGLRSDLSWIELVAEDPAAEAGIDEYGVPLTPAELAELQGRRNPLDYTATELLTELREYGALFPASFAGAYLDQRVAIGFVVMFSRDVDRHRMALANLFPRVVHLDVQQVRWSLAELEGFEAQVGADLAWMPAGQATLLGAGRRATENFVYLQYLGPIDMGTNIARHYGSPSWLSVERAGPLPWTGPVATLIVDVRARDGTPMPGIRCEAISLNPEVQISEDNLGTDSHGRCTRAGLPVGTYRLVFYRFVDNDRYVEATTLDVSIEAPQTQIEVRLP